MVRDLERARTDQTFPTNAPCANPVFFRTYSRRISSESAVPRRETWAEVCARSLGGLSKLGQLTPEEHALVERMQLELKALPSGRWLWVGGTKWMENPQNFSGGYNCTSTNVIDWRSFGLMMDLAMMGCGTGAILEARYIDRLPVICNQITVELVGQIGTTLPELRQEQTRITTKGNTVRLQVGDSRQGWVSSYQTILELSSDQNFDGTVNIAIDLSDVRPAGESLKGFGGVANPVKLPELYQCCANILNKVVGRKLTSIECCLLIDQAASCIVAGNIRRCLPAGALVHTEAGLVPIEKIRIGDRVLTSQGLYPVTNFFAQGVQYLCEVITAHGTFECTADHKVAVLSTDRISYRMVKAKDLTASECLVFVPQAISGTATELPESKVTSLTVPALTNDVAYFLGYLAAHSCITEDSLQLSVSPEHHQIVDRLVSAIAAFGVEVHTFSQSDSFDIQVTSQALAIYLARLTKPQASGVVPECILLGTQRIRQAYLAGLATTQPQALAVSGEQKFLKQIQALYASLGIATRLSEISTSDPRQGKLLSAHTAKNPLAVPASLNSNFSAREYSKDDPQLLSLIMNQQLTETAELIPVRVQSIKFNTRKAATYDIEVASIHEFVCEGVLVSNSAGMRQFSSDDTIAATAKDNLWVQDAEGNWRVDAERDALRMANHTHVYHHKPTLEECINVVRKQYNSGEGAIQWAGEAVARSNRDLLADDARKAEFLTAYDQGEAASWLTANYPDLSPAELEHRLGRFGLNPCGEILGADFHCNLAEVHLNQLNPFDFKEQEDAFKAAGLAVAALLNHQFSELRYRYSRAVDPIVGVSFTGLFDFFVHAFGVNWLRWWEAGRPTTPEGLEFQQRERAYLTTWREAVHRAVGEYCLRHGLRQPNRCTTVQPAGTKSLLTGAAPGWHPPKAQRYIRRITFAKNDPVALACLDFGYAVVPSQADKDESGKLLDDPFDTRCTEWLVEIPVEVPWANLLGADQIELEKFSALAQFDFYLNVQSAYTTHNTSATIELHENEIEALGQRIYEAIRDNEGYVSAALLARFDAPFPRLPFEKIDKATHDRLCQEVAQRKYTDDFAGAVVKYDLGLLGVEGPAGCDAMGCLVPEAKKHK